MKRSTPTKKVFPNALQTPGRAFRPVAALGLTAVLAFGGTVSPQLKTMDPNQPVQIVVQHGSSPLGGLLPTVCGVLSLMDILPGGELCSITVTDSINLANDPRVDHSSVNNGLVGTESPIPGYEYKPETIEPSFTSVRSANANLGNANLGSANLGKDTTAVWPN